MPATAKDILAHQASFRLGIAAVQSVFQLGPALVMGASPTWSALNVEQLHPMAQTLLDLSVQAGYVALAFFGLFNLSIG